MGKRTVKTIKSQRRIKMNTIGSRLHIIDSSLLANCLAFFCSRLADMSAEFFPFYFFDS